MFIEYRIDLIEIYNNKPNENILAILLGMKLYKRDSYIRNEINCQITNPNNGNNLDYKIFNIYNDNDVIKTYSDCISFTEEGIDYFFRIFKQINPAIFRYCIVLMF